MEVLTASGGVTDEMYPDFHHIEIRYLWRTAEWCSAALIELSPGFAAALMGFWLCEVSYSAEMSWRAGALWELHRWRQQLDAIPSTFIISTRNGCPSFVPHLPDIIFSENIYSVVAVDIRGITHPPIPPFVLLPRIQQNLLLVALNSVKPASVIQGGLSSSSVIAPWQCRLFRLQRYLYPSLPNVPPHLL